MATIPKFRPTRHELPSGMIDMVAADVELFGKVLDIPGMTPEMEAQIEEQLTAKLALVMLRCEDIGVSLFIAYAIMAEESTREFFYGS